MIRSSPSLASITALAASSPPLVPFVPAHEAHERAVAAAAASASATGTQGPSHATDTLDFGALDCSDADSWANELAELYSYVDAAELPGYQQAWLALVPDAEENGDYGNVLDRLVGRMVQGTEGDGMARTDVAEAVLYFLYGLPHTLPREMDREEFQQRQMEAMLRNIRVFRAVPDLIPRLVRVLMYYDALARPPPQHHHHQQQGQQQTGLEGDDGEEHLPEGSEIKSDRPHDAHAHAHLNLLLAILYHLLLPYTYPAPHPSLQSPPSSSSLSSAPITETERRSLSEEVMALETPLPVLLLGIVASLRDRTATGWPVKKLLLVLWKSIMVGFGTSGDLKACKDYQRFRQGLPPARSQLDARQSSHHQHPNQQLSVYPPTVPLKSSPASEAAFYGELSTKFPTFDLVRRPDHAPLFLDPLPPGRQPLDLSSLVKALAPIPQRAPYHSAPLGPASEIEQQQQQGDSGNGPYVHQPTPPPTPPPVANAPNVFEPPVKNKKSQLQTVQTRPFPLPISKAAHGKNLVPWSLQEANQLFEQRRYISLALLQLSDSRREWQADEQLAAAGQVPDQCRDPDLADLTKEKEDGPERLPHGDAETADERQRLRHVAVAYVRATSCGRKVRVLKKA